MNVWYKKYERGPKGNGFIANCANTGIDMLTAVAEECPEGYGTLEDVVKPTKKRKADDSDD